MRPCEKEKQKKNAVTGDFQVRLKFLRKMENLGNKTSHCLHIFTKDSKAVTFLSVKKPLLHISWYRILALFYHIGNPWKWRITRFAFFVSPTLQLCLFLMERVNHMEVCNRLLEVQFISFSFLCCYKYKGLDLDRLRFFSWICFRK